VKKEKLKFYLPFILLIGHLLLVNITVGLFDDVYYFDSGDELMNTRMNPYLYIVWGLLYCGIYYLVLAGFKRVYDVVMINQHSKNRVTKLADLYFKINVGFAIMIPLFFTPLSQSFREVDAEVIKNNYVLIYEILQYYIYNAYITLLFSASEYALFAYICYLNFKMTKHKIKYVNLVFIILGALNMLELYLNYFSYSLTIIKNLIFVDMEPLKFIAVAGCLYLYYRRREDYIAPAKNF
jgi:hypothetical protein